jgi:alpha,alpha-trehalose phosphorylase
MRYRGRILHVQVRHHAATYCLIEGDPLPILHYGREVTVSKEESTHKIPALPVLPAPAQPAGRAPAARHGRS